jgi:flagellin-specific chaperone FliS
VILQQLQGSLDMENGAEAAANLSGFYSALRGKIFEAHTKADPAILRQQIEFVIDVRQAWQQVDKPNLGPADGANELLAARREAAATGEEAVSVSWTA